MSQVQLAGYDQRAKELREDCEKTGCKGILRKYAKESEAAGYHYGAAASYAMLAEKDAAFAAQEQAAAAGSHLDAIKLNPPYPAALENLRSDSRYPALLRRIGLPQ